MKKSLYTLNEKKNTNEFIFFKKKIKRKYIANEFIFVKKN